MLQAGAAGLGYLYTGPAFSVVKAAGANDRLRVAGIGVGGKGSSDIDQAAALMEVVAVCDIEDARLNAKTKKWPSAKGFVDYRKLFDDASLMTNIDAVVVSTPDHHHALASILAMRAGKHVYTQKPLTHTVFEARLMREAAKKYKVCTQMGNQGTTENGLRRAVELIQAGVIGPVKEVHAWTNRPVWPQAPEVTSRPKEAPVPQGVHWDEFIGPAPFRPYAEYDKSVPRRYGNRLGAYHDFHWRGWWDFGTGAIGDMACHTANMAFMALKLGLPTRVRAEAGDVNPETCPSYAHVVMEFPARDQMPPVKFHWYEGRKDGWLVQPPAELAAKVLALDPNEKRNKALVNSGSIIIGEKGMIYSPNDYGAEFFIGPKGQFEGLNTKTPEKLPINNKGDQGQKNEWVEAIRAGKPETALANFEYGSMLTESFLLGNIAIRTQSAFEYDGATGTIPGNPAAAKLLANPYRRGWDLLGDKA
jgi:predicted dehydrogenase